jgi:hypothetical protein
MSDAEAKLAAFFREDRPRSSDAAFRLAVLERRARHRFHVFTAWVVAGGALAVGCVAAISPNLTALNLSQPLSGAAPLLSVLVTGACMTLAYIRTRQSF